MATNMAVQLCVFWHLGDCCHNTRPMPNTLHCVWHGPAIYNYYIYKLCLFICEYAFIVPSAKKEKKWKPPQRNSYLRGKFNYSSYDFLPELSLVFSSKYTQHHKNAKWPSFSGSDPQWATIEYILWTNNDPHCDNYMQVGICIHVHVCNICSKKNDCWM